MTDEERETKLYEAGWRKVKYMDMNPFLWVNPKVDRGYRKLNDACAMQDNIERTAYNARQRAKVRAGRAKR